MVVVKGAREPVNRMHKEGKKEYRDETLGYYIRLNYNRRAVMELRKYKDDTFRKLKKSRLYSRGSVVAIAEILYVLYLVFNIFLAFQ